MCFFFQQFHLLYNLEVERDENFAVSSQTSQNHFQNRRDETRRAEYTFHFDETSRDELWLEPYEPKTSQIEPQFWKKNEPNEPDFITFNPRQIDGFKRIWILPKFH